MLPRNHTTPNAEDVHEEAVRAWKELLAGTTLPVRETVWQVVREGSEALTEDFYRRMQAAARATTYLDQQRVQKRLRASMRQWMIDLFGTLDAEHIPASIQRQMEAGMVHARIRLPVDLISAGVRLLKRSIRRRIEFTALDTNERTAAQLYVSDLLHLADSLMNQAYTQDLQQVVRNDEAYRLVTQKRGLGFERTRQRAALSEWSEGVLIAAWRQAGPPRPLGESEFGIWMRHKGATMFEGSTEFQAIQEAIETMDQHLLSRWPAAGTDRSQADSCVAAIKQLLDLIRYQLNDLFESSMGREDGLDMETQLPDRRYLPAILAREMQVHQSSQRPFCLLLVELQFPTLKGPEAAGSRSRLLQAAAQITADCARTTDHLFRYAENRLLLLAVECSRSAASELATTLSEHLRHSLNTGNVQGSWTPVRSSVFIGIAEYDGHPDHQFFLQRVETALAEALDGKRSRIALA